VSSPNERDRDISEACRNSTTRVERTLIIAAYREEIERERVLTALAPLNEQEEADVQYLEEWCASLPNDDHDYIRGEAVKPVIEAFRKRFPKVE
jgi:hypothetical protein